MAKNVDTQKLIAMADALYIYSNSVKGHLENLKRLANECNENLDNDDYTGNALKTISSVISISEESTARARNLAGKLQEAAERLIRGGN